MLERLALRWFRDDQRSRVEVDPRAGIERSLDVGLLLDIVVSRSSGETAVLIAT